MPASASMSLLSLRSSTQNCWKVKATTEAEAGAESATALATALAEARAHAKAEAAATLAAALAEAKAEAAATLAAALTEARAEARAEAKPSMKNVIPGKEQQTASYKMCNELKNPPAPRPKNITVGPKLSLDVAIVRGDIIHSSYSNKTRFILYVPAGFPEPNALAQERLRSILIANSQVDAVGGNMIHGDLLMPRCHNIELCHWTALLHFEYSCSKGPLMQCDMTSNVFMIRAVHAEMLKHAAVSMGELAPLSVFIGLQEKGRLVVTDASLQINVGNTKVHPAPVIGSTRAHDMGLRLTDSQRLSFLRKHAVDEIRNRDTDHVYRVCTNSTCDAQTLKKVLGGAGTWSSMGTSMPTFAYEAYVRAFHKAVLFLEDNNITYHLYAGGELGMFKLGGRLLPWDTGDVDFVVNVGHSEGACKTWLAKLKSWADANHFIHPHTSGKGGSCSHYGAYAMPKKQHSGRSSNVNDPVSLGLVTFTNHLVKTRKESDCDDRTFVYVPTVHGTQVRVRSDQWKCLWNKYGDSLLSSMDHARRKHNCTAKPDHKHNCLHNTNGIHLDTCMEHTRLMRAMTQYDLETLTTWDRPMYEALLEQRLREVDSRKRRSGRSSGGSSGKNSNSSKISGGGARK